MCPVNVIVGSSKQQEAGPSKAKKPKRVRKKAAKAKAGASEPAVSERCKITWYKMALRNI
jgi:hypothetical protein